jgi:homogentisate 1,2-dioxygenase
MAHYYSLGQIPKKRHTQFRKPDGGLYAEQLFSTEGFSSNYSLLYHIHPPTQIVRSEEPVDVSPKRATDNILKHRCYQGFNVKPEDNFLDAKKTVLFNSDVHLSLAAPRKGLEGNVFYKNADCDEVIFIHEGSGKLKTQYGQIPFEYGDYVVIPRGTIYQIVFDTPDNRLFIVDSFSPITFPKRYLSKYGQLLEHAPYCERDIKKPQDLETIDEKGEYEIKMKKNGMMYSIWYGTHPFDVVGWDGYEYPYAISIHDFEPITGRVHQPPPVHQQFDAHNFVICSFVPRLYDYHPQSIPAPYNHSNIDSDEVLYYVDGEFMSRKHVDRGMITLHPGGIPHGPHPGAVEKSIGQKETPELAVMVDTFRPLYMTELANQIESEGYDKSWMD